MTEAQDPRASVDTEASWTVDGAQASPSTPSEGLGDTVVKMPKIPGRNSSVKPTMGKGRPPAASKAGGTKPSIPKPTRTDDLMAAFDEPTPGSKPATPPAPVAPVAAVPVTPSPAAVAPASVPVSSVVRPPNVKPATASSAPAPTARRTRKARLRVARLDPWSVMKTVFLFSVAFGIMAWVATYLLWQVAAASGLFSAINDAMNSVANPNNTEGWRIEDSLNANKVLGVTALLAAINVIITTALGTVGAFLYNLSANILGGLELTLAED